MFVGNLISARVGYGDLPNSKKREDNLGFKYVCLDVQRMLNQLSSSYTSEVCKDMLSGIDSLDGLIEAVIQEPLRLIQNLD